jgi:hypothetical protein
LDEFGMWPTVFDRRSEQREAALLATFSHYQRPLILVGLESVSSPLKNHAEIYSRICEDFGETHKVINLSKLRCERIYDLLGLFDRAACLVTADTAHLHLARASKVPVVALISVLFYIQNEVDEAIQRRVLCLENGRPWDGTGGIPEEQVAAPAPKAGVKKAAAPAGRKAAPAAPVADAADEETVGTAALDAVSTVLGVKPNGLTKIALKTEAFQAVKKANGDELRGQGFLGIGQMLEETCKNITALAVGKLTRQ